MDGCVSLDWDLHVRARPVAKSVVSAVREVTRRGREGNTEIHTYPFKAAVPRLANVPRLSGKTAKRGKDDIGALPVFNPLLVSMSFPRKPCRAFKLERNEHAYTVKCSRRTERSASLEVGKDRLTTRAEVIEHCRDGRLWELQNLNKRRGSEHP